MKRLTFTVIFIFIPLFAACKAKIGDDCTYDADCSANMDRYCDSSQPGGYCLIIGCGPDECPEEASCVNFITPCPTGPGYEKKSDTGPGYEEESDTGPGYEEESDAGPGYEEESDTGPGYEEEFDKCSIIEPNRGRTYCMLRCGGDGDCRSGYRCVDPGILWGSVIDFSGSSAKICVPD